MDLFDWHDARQAGEEAGEACKEKAESQGWDSEAATAFILAYLRQHGPTPGEVLVTETSRVYAPHDARAFGPIFSKLKRRGLIEDCGHARRTKGHGTAGGIIWVLKAK